MPALWRKVETSFWREANDEELSSDERLLQLFLETNDATNLSGIYKISMVTMQNGTGLDYNHIKKALHGLQSRGIVIYDETYKEMLLVGWVKKNPWNSPKCTASIKSSLLQIKSLALIEHRQMVLEGDDPIGPPIFREKKEEEEKKSDNTPYEKIISYLNKKTGRSFQIGNEAYRSLIRARYREGKTDMDFKKVIDLKVHQWKDDIKTREWLRPTTLFGTKFDQYLNEGPISVTSTKNAILCPICKTDCTSISSPTCPKCSFTLANRDDAEKAEAYKEEIVAAGLGERIGIE
jgi:uncharacterized phage protein (TIGR02220 family)